MNNGAKKKLEGQQNDSERQKFNEEKRNYVPIRPKSDLVNVLNKRVKTIKVVTKGVNSIKVVTNGDNPRSQPLKLTKILTKADALGLTSPVNAMASPEQELPVQQPLASPVNPAPFGIQIIQQILNSNGEIQQIPFYLNNDQLEIIRKQILGQDTNPPIVVHAAPVQQNAAVKPVLQTESEASLQQVPQLQKPKAGQVNKGIGGIRIVQQFLNGKGEIQQIPFQLTQNQLELLRMQMRGENNNQSVIIRAVPEEPNAAVSNVQNITTQEALFQQANEHLTQQPQIQSVYQIQQVAQATGQVATTAPPVFIT